MPPLLSILTPAIPDRLNKLDGLMELVQHQLDDLPEGIVEHLVFIDNRTRSVGLKRQALLDVARGEYIAYLDDDDWISENYVRLITSAAQRGRDVITFEQQAEIDGKRGHINFSINAPSDAPWQEDQTVTRPPWHICAWKRDLVKDCVFPDINDGEDIVWCQQARQRIRTETHIASVLHHYRFDHTLTAATGR